MDTYSVPVAMHSSELKTSLHAEELLPLLKELTTKVKVLSLDCFDTLIWRKTLIPRDVFYHLNHFPKLKDKGFTPLMRARGEELASHLKKVQYGSSHPSLFEIYQTIYPDLTTQGIEEFVNNELQCELEVCYAFLPVIELIKLAFKLNKKIIIVSDTYFTEHQLRKLLSNKLPADVMNAISEIFCSCENGKSKQEGLFNVVIDKLKIPANEILHIGDNPIADFNSPRRLGIHAFQFIQHKKNIAEIIRTQAIAAGFLDSSIRNSRGLMSPFRALFSMEPSDAPETLIGYATLGPIMYAFSRFIDEEIKELKKQGKNVKVIFLMRDAYLPALACKELLGDTVGVNIRISRFMAIAASFRTQNDIDIYLAENIDSMRFQDICNQLLFSSDFTQKIHKALEVSKNPKEEFVFFIRSENVSKMILENSKEFRGQLIAYLKKETNIEPNDTLLCVDLGYTGTTQLKLAPILKDEMNVEMLGRYLIALPINNWLETRKGLIDPTHYDDKLLSMLVTYISTLEQLSTSGESSAIGFDNKGIPSQKTQKNNHINLDKLKKVHEECKRFIKEAKTFLKDENLRITAQNLRDSACLSLMRLLFLPTHSELEFLQDFQHDVNLGTNETFPLFDVNKGLNALQKRSWLFCLKEKTKDMRMNYFSELRAINIELPITLMAQQCFDFEVALNDLSHLREKIEVVIGDQETSSSLVFEALPTHHGFYALTIPIIAQSQISIKFGINYHWFELKSVEMIALQFLYSYVETLNSEDARQQIIFDQMLEHQSNLFECSSQEGAMVFKSPLNLTLNSHVLRVVFRPISHY